MLVAEVVQKDKCIDTREESDHAGVAAGRAGHPGHRKSRQQSSRGAPPGAYAGGKVSRPAADFLVNLHKRVGHPNPAFEQLFYRAIKDHVLVDGRIDAEEAAWLRKALLADGKIRDEERKFLNELKGEARQTSREFDALFVEAMKLPQESHTN